MFQVELKKHGLLIMVHSLLPALIRIKNRDFYSAKWILDKERGRLKREAGREVTGGPLMPACRPGYARKPEGDGSCKGRHFKKV